MDEMRDTREDQTTGAGSSAFADEPLPGDGEDSRKAREWLAQLQAMIDDVATQAAPMLRQVGAKAAELAAVAAEKAGPAAHRAAEVTAGASAKFAERAHKAADDLRKQATNGDTPAWDDTSDETTGTPSGTGSSI